MNTVYLYHVCLCIIALSCYSFTVVRCEAPVSGAEQTKNRTREDCDKPKEEGTCKGNHTSTRFFYYNATAGKCESFLSSCEGNKHNFVREEDCKHLCEKHVNDTHILTTPSPVRVENRANLTGEIVSIRKDNHSQTSTKGAPGAGAKLVSDLKILFLSLLCFHLLFSKIILF